MANEFEEYADLEDFEDFEEFPKDAPPMDPRRPPRPGLVLNVLSGCLVAATLLVALIFAVIFLYPQSMINPLPPTTLPALVLTSTPTPTAKGILPPTWTPTMVPSSTATETPTPTNTPQPTATETVGPEALPTTELDENASFIIQEGYPQYSENDIQPDAGCSWMGVVGQVLDDSGEPVNGILVETGGFLGETEVQNLTMSGMTNTVGEGGFAIKLSDSPQFSEGQIWIQLVDQSNLPLSDQIYFDTSDACEENQIRINFIQRAE